MGSPESEATLRAHLAVHVGLRPDDVMVMVNDHGAAEHMQVFHHILLGVGQRGDLCVVAWLGWGFQGCGTRRRECHSEFLGRAHMPAPSG